MTEHRHGGRVFEAALDLGVPWSRILDFSANINPLGQPGGLRNHLFRSFPETVHYPDVDAGSLTDAIASATGLPRETILPGAGSTPHIRMIARILSPERPVIICPAFAEYAEAILAASSKPAFVTAPRESGFLVTPEVVGKAAELDPDLLFLANPANPTGRLLPESTFAALLSLSERTGCRVVLDEAFIDFTGSKSHEAAAAETERILILRSLTKIFAIPGLRLAYLVGHRETIRPLAEQLEPWPLNCMALEAGLYCIPRRDFVEATPARTAKLRGMLVKTLRPYGSVVPSDANFVLMDAGEEAPGIVRRLYARGILVRDASNFHGLGPGWLRFAVRPTGEIRALALALAGAPAADDA
ncbi:MAG: aminotransferase class I/II-fold pyridoxal phosphate-dependent enzyme [Deltaproteobacteria bacterium]|nr:aminotransferase class I/II-fold pyridoxal phosphate-dependent enzyme [Deltaproteobacteria bacterium]